MQTASRVAVSDEIPDAALPDGLRSFAVDGATPTQRGIFVGASILLENTDLTFTQYVNDEPYTVYRRPNIILMTDGEPTIGWTDYRFANPASNTDSGRDVGNGLSTDLGLSLLTVLTASYMRQRVHAHYFGSDTARSVGFFTIGFGEDSAIVRAAMDPFGPNNGGVNADMVNQLHAGNTYHMRQLLDRFVSEHSITLPVLNSNSNTQRTLRTITNPGGFVQSADFVSIAFSAMDEAALNEAFSTIAQQIISQGSYSTRVLPNASPDLCGYLVFSDVLGRGMEFRGIKGLWLEETQCLGDRFAREITGDIGGTRNEFIELLVARDYGLEGVALSREQAQVLLLSNLAAGSIDYSEDGFSSRLLYYTDENRQFLGSFFELDGSPAAQPENAMSMVQLFPVRGHAQNPVTGERTDLRNSSVYVITALQDGAFVCGDGVLMRNLQAGDQLVRWYIPASLIPLRTVTSVVDENGVVTDQVQVSEAAAIRLMYAVGLNAERMLTAGVPVGGYFYTNQWDAPENVALAFFQPNVNNPYYQTASELAQPKAENLTQTSGFARQGGYFYSNNKQRVAAYILGNNGRMAVPTTEVSVVKQWDARLADSGNLNPEWIQLFGNGEPIGPPVLLSPGGPLGENQSAAHTWQNLLLYELRPDALGNAVPIIYAVVEGTWDGTEFIPYGPENEAPFHIDITQPKRNKTGWSTAYILNFDPTEPETTTEPTEESTEPSTEETTMQPTEESTEPSTEETTTQPTEESTEPSTEEPTTTTSAPPTETTTTAITSSQTTQTQATQPTTSATTPRTQPQPTTSAATTPALPTKPPPTGDSRLVIIIVAVVGAASLAGILLLKKRKND